MGRKLKTAKKILRHLDMIATAPNPFIVDLSEPRQRKPKRRR